jgi:urea transport system permease protein
VRKLLLIFCLLAAPAWALERAALEKLVSDDNDVKIEGIQALVAEGDPAAVPLQQRHAHGEVEIDGKVVEVIANNRVRAAVGDALAGLRLVSPERAQRLTAAAELAKGADVAMLPLIKRALSAEKDPEIRDLLGLAAAAMELTTGGHAAADIHVSSASKNPPVIRPSSKAA